jgi:AbiTii
LGGKPLESIVLELQREAISSKTIISDLLRKALFVARKLKVKEFEDWITQELNGYQGSSTEIPQYREFIGKLQHFNPYHGWCPVIVQDEKIVDIFTKRKIGQPISEIEYLMNGDFRTLAIPLPQGQQNMLSDYFNEPTQFQLEISESQLVRVKDTVRNIILEWSLKLEEDGIMGEGLSFSEKEKQEASKQNYNINNFYGNASGIQIQQNSPNSTQTMTNGVDVGQIADIVAKLKENLNQIGLPAEQQAVVQSEVETISAELVSPQPQPSVMKKSLQSIRTVLEGAGGNLAASGLMFLIDKIQF